MMDGFDVSGEFRNRISFGDEHRASTLAFERELGVVHTIVDAPQGFQNSVPAVWEVAHPKYALVRLHGRNADPWDVKGATAASDRFNYDDPAHELASLAADIEGLDRMGLEAHVVSNNNMEDQGQRNAASLAMELERIGAAVRPARAAVVHDSNGAGLAPADPKSTGLPFDDPVFRS